MFSICTLVTEAAQHAAMRTSFVAGGFGTDEAEYLHLDNSRGNDWDAYAGIAALLGRARGRYAILCHQDVRLLEDGAACLQQRIAELDALDPAWAVAGNAGVTADGRLALRISDPHGEDQRRGALPARVTSLDENFLLLRRDAGLMPSAGIGGFHLYGTDLCLQARRQGRSAWVIDFHLRHLSAGRVDAAFLDAQHRFERVWGLALGTGERIRTTCTSLTLRGGWLGGWVGAWRLGRRRARLRT